MTASPLHPSLQLAWALANREALFSGSPTIEPLHLLGALLLIVDDCALGDTEAMGLPADVMEEIGRQAAEARRRISLPEDRITALRRELIKSLHQDSRVPRPGLLHRSEESRGLFAQAVEVAEEQGDDAPNMLHLLEAFMRRLPAEDGAASGEPFAVLVRRLQAQAAEVIPAASHVRSTAGKADLLGELGRDLTALAREGRLPPVVGRKSELTALARHLQRTSKRNVLIIGEAGVGKTAIVEGFAQRIASGEVPDFLLDLRIVQINVGDLVAGTHYRGDMEQRMKSVIEEVTADPNLVLFLDEIHLVVNAGTGGDASLDVANILKPALSRDDFRCVGATTVDEYERHIKSDMAFLRRFQLLRVAEPSREESLAVCEAWARRIERMQEVEFANDAVPAAVELSAEFISGRALPDKAIDLLENAAVLVKISTLSPQPAEPTKSLPMVTRAHIVTVIEEQYGVSVRRSGLLDGARIGSELREWIVGQEEAIEVLARELNALGVQDKVRTGPLGVFLFTGPTGTGKTFTAERLGRALFPDRPNSVVRFNMNEFKERHEMARLLGAPPGFVGHDQPGAIFRFAETHPQGLIILDEMEKAHPEVQDYFLQIFDKGESLDSRGRKMDLRPYVFVMTCNLTTGGKARPRVGFVAEEAAESDVLMQDDRDELLRHFRREFLARIQKVVEFKEIDRDGYGMLLERRFAALAARAEHEHSVELRIAERAKTEFVEFCAGQADGCREFERLFDRLVAVPVIEHLRDESHSAVVTLAQFADGRPQFE